MHTNVENLTNETTKYVEEISGLLIAYSRFLIGAGTLAILAAAFLSNFGFAGTFGLGGLFLLITGVLIGILSQEFSRLRRWTYPIVKFLVGTSWGFIGASADRFPEKIRSAELRCAFGLEPLSDSEQDDHQKNHPN